MRLALSVVVFLLFGAGSAVAATATWTDASGDGLWSTAANWSTGAAPSTGDSVVFDSTSTSNATVDIPVTVASISVASGYTGTIDQQATVSASGSISLAAGTWVAHSQTITCGGDFSVAGSGGVFNAGTSTVTLTGSGLVSAPADNFYNLRVAASGATTTMASDVVVTNRCTVVAGTLDFHHGGAGFTLHLRGSGQLLDMQGSLNAGAPNVSGVSYEATSSTPVRVEGIAYGYASLRFISVGGAAGVFDQTGPISATDDIWTSVDTAGGSLVWNTNGFDVSTASWMSVGSWGSSAGGTTINAGASHITVPVICWFTTSGDVVNMESSSWRVANWATWTSGATVNVGTSTVTITGGDLGPAWAWWGVPHQFYDLVIDAGGTVTTHGAVSVQHDLTVANGTLDTNDWALAIAHDATVGAGGNIVARTSTISVGHSLTIPAGAGHFTADTSTVTMTGTGSIMNADPANAFYNLSTAQTGQTTTLASDVTVTHRCTVVAGTLDFHTAGTGYVLHLQGSGQVLDMQGALNAGAPGVGGVSYEGTSSAPMQVEGIDYGYASVRLVSLGGAAAVFQQAGSIRATDDIYSAIDTAGGSVTWDMNGHDVSSASWISVGNWGSAAGGTTINAGAAHVTAPSICWFTTSGDVVNMDSSSWTVANWATWTSGAIVNVGTSTVTITGGDIGPFWAWWGVPHQFYNLVIYSGGSVAVHGDVQVHHDLTVLAGGLDTNGWNVSVDGNIAVTPGVLLAAGGVTLSLSGTGAQEVDLGTAATIGSLAVAGGNRVISFPRSVTADTISCAAGPTMITAAGQTLSTSHLNLAGTSELPITLTSGTPGSSWYLRLASGGTQSLAYVQAQDSDAHLGLQIDDHLTGTDLGHNSNWLFPGSSQQPNQPPSFTKGPDQTVLEDAGAQSVATWATNISPGPSGESGQAVTFIVSNDNTALFSIQPAVSSLGTLTYTPAPDANGTATVSVQAHDDGGTANGGVDTSAVQTFTITVTAVNDPPTLAAISDPQPILEDAGQQTIALSGIGAGPPNENGQTLTVSATSSNPALIPSPTVAYTSPNATGTLSYTPVANANGMAVITVTVHDDGGHANGGVDTTTRTFTVTVTPVNDAPSFMKGADQTVAVDAGAQTVAQWATGISPGPADESSQTVDFIVATDHPEFFSIQPAISPTGTLTYTPTSAGTAVVTVRLHDDGGTANGGVDTSPAQTFTISIASLVDLALNKPATQSSTYPYSGNPVAALAVDGNTDGVYTDGSVTSTNDDVNAWWQVDLGARYAVSRIDIFNRTDAVPERLSDYYVLLSDDPFLSTDLSQTLAQPGVTALHQQTTAGTPTSLAVSRTARYVRVQLAGQNYLSLAEVEVMGIASPLPSITITAPIAGTRIPEHGSMTIAADATDPTGSVQAVDFYADQVLIGHDTNGSDGWSATWSDVPPGLHSLSAVMTDHTGGTTTSASVAISTISSSGQAIFLDRDDVSSGDWKSSYGADGHIIVGNHTTIPSYAAVTEDGGIATWAASTTDPRALETFDGLSRIAATRWTGSSLTYAIDVGPAAHRVAFYFLDWDAQGRTETVDLLDAGSGAVLDTRTVSSFSQGVYLVYQVTGAVQMRLTLVGGPNAVMAGVFFGDSFRGYGAGQATFTSQDGDTHGDWRSKYGSDGAIVVGDATALPAYATVIEDGGIAVWDANPSDPRALSRLSGAGSIAAARYTYSSLTYAINVGANPRQLAFYFLDWDSNSRVERIDLLDGLSGTVLDTRSISGFNQGVYLVYNVSGFVRMRMTVTGGANGVMSGVFFGPGIPQTPNSAPSFTKGPDQTVLEDAGPQTVTGWASAISAGPENESWQTVSFIVSTDQPALFSAGPTISPNGTLTYTTAPDANGSATISVQAHDNGGTLNGGLDTSAAQTFTITVLPVNDPPSFTKGPDIHLNLGDGQQTILGWATAITPGPADESGQTVDFLVSVDRPELFSVPPTITPDGTLTFTPITVSNGTALVTVRLHDSGGTALGGSDTSVPQTFTITIGGIHMVAPATADGASPATITSTSATLAALADDGTGTDTSLVYTWQALGIPPSPVSFTKNWTRDASTTIVTFTGPGSYNFSVTATDDAGDAIVSTVAVTVVAAPAAITATPSAGVVLINQQLSYTAAVTDQFGQPVAAPVAWTTTVPGSGFAGTNVLNAGSSSGHYLVTATSGSATTSVPVYVNAAPTLSAITATPNGTTIALSVVGADDDVDGLTYQWSLYRFADVPFQFAPNGTHDASSTVLSLTTVARGTYYIQVVATDAGGATATATTTVPIAQVATGVQVFPGPTTVTVGASIFFYGYPVDQFGNQIGVFSGGTTWSVNGPGTVDANGNFVATGAGDATVTMTADGFSGSVVVHISGAPRITAPPAAAISVDHKSASLSVVATDADGEENLTYTWGAVGVQPGNVHFVDNGTNSAKNTTITVDHVGTYEMEVTVSKPDGETTSATISITVDPLLTALGIDAPFSSVDVGGTLALTTTASDQFGNPLSVVGPTWSVTGDSSIDASGILHGAPSPENATVTVTIDGQTATKAIAVLPAATLVIDEASLTGDKRGTLNGESVAFTNRHAVTITLTGGSTDPSIAHSIVTDDGFEFPIVPNMPTSITLNEGRRTFTEREVDAQNVETDYVLKDSGGQRVVLIVDSKPPILSFRLASAYLHSGDPARVPLRSSLTDDRDVVYLNGATEDHNTDLRHNRAMNVFAKQGFILEAEADDYSGISTNASFAPAASVSGGEAHDLSVAVDNSAVPARIRCTGFEALSDSISFDPDTLAVASFKGRYIVHITVSDRAGNTSDADRLAIWVDTVPPTAKLAFAPYQFQAFPYFQVNADGTTMFSRSSYVMSSFDAAYCEQLYNGDYLQALRQGPNPEGLPTAGPIKTLSAWALARTVIISTPPTTMNSEADVRLTDMAGNVSDLVQIPITWKETVTDQPPIGELVHVYNPPYYTGVDYYYSVAPVELPPEQPMGNEKVLWRIGYDSNLLDSGGLISKERSLAVDGSFDRSDVFGQTPYSRGGPNWWAGKATMIFSALSTGGLSTQLVQVSPSWEDRPSIVVVDNFRQQVDAYFEPWDPQNYNINTQQYFFALQTGRPSYSEDEPDHGVEHQTTAFDAGGHPFGTAVVPHDTVPGAVRGKARYDGQVDQMFNYEQKFNFALVNLVKLDPDVIPPGQATTVRIEANFKAPGSMPYDFFDPNGDYVHFIADGKDITETVQQYAATQDPDERKGKITILRQRLRSDGPNATLGQALELDLEVGHDVASTFCDVDLKFGPFFSNTASPIENQGLNNAYRLPQALAVNSSKLIDVIVDSDNNNGIGLPDENLREDLIENLPHRLGKAIVVNGAVTRPVGEPGTPDEFNAIPDYADGFATAGFDNRGDGVSRPFVPMVVKIDPSVDLSQVTVHLDYDASDPQFVVKQGDATAGYHYDLPADGVIRVWTKNGTSSRNAQALGSGGDFVAPGDYTPSRLGLTDTNRRVVFYVEAVRPSLQTQRTSISATLLNNPVPAQDTVHVSCLAINPLLIDAYQGEATRSLDNIIGLQGVFDPAEIEELVKPWTIASLPNHALWLTKSDDAAPTSLDGAATSGYQFPKTLSMKVFGGLPPVKQATEVWASDVTNYSLTITAPNIIDQLPVFPQFSIDLHRAQVTIEPDTTVFPLPPFGSDSLFGNRAALVVHTSTNTHMENPSFYQTALKAGDIGAVSILGDAGSFPGEYRLWMSGEQCGLSVVQISAIIDGSPRVVLEAPVYVDPPSNNNPHEHQIVTAEANAAALASAAQAGVAASLTNAPEIVTQSGDVVYPKAGSPHSVVLEEIAAREALYQAGQILPHSTIDGPTAWFLPFNLGGQVQFAQTGADELWGPSVAQLALMITQGGSSTPEALQPLIEAHAPDQELWRRFARHYTTGNQVRPINRAQTDPMANARLDVEYRAKELLERAALARLKEYFSINQDPSTFVAQAQAIANTSQLLPDFIADIAQYANASFESQPLAVAGVTTEGHQINQNIKIRATGSQAYRDFFGWDSPIERLLATPVTPNWGVGHRFTEELVQHMWAERLDVVHQTYQSIAAALPDPASIAWPFRARLVGTSGAVQSLPDSDPICDLPVQVLPQIDTTATLPFTFVLGANGTLTSDWVTGGNGIFPRTSHSIVDHGFSGVGMPLGLGAQLSLRNPFNDIPSSPYFERGDVFYYRIEVCGLGQTHAANANDISAYMAVMAMQEMSLLTRMSSDLAAAQFNQMARNQNLFSFCTYLVGKYAFGAQDIAAAFYGQDVETGTTVSGIDRIEHIGMAGLMLLEPAMKVGQTVYLGASGMARGLRAGAAANIPATQAALRASAIRTTEDAVSPTTAVTSTRQAVDASGRIVPTTVQSAAGLFDSVFTDITAASVEQRALANVGCARMNQMAVAQGGDRILQSARGRASFELGSAAVDVSEAVSPELRTAKDAVAELADLSDVEAAVYARDGLDGLRKFRAICCFPAGTPVVMEDGSTKPIEAVVVGDRVASRSELHAAAPVEGCRVEATTVKQAKALVRLVLRSEGRDCQSPSIVISCTQSHPLWSVEDGWIPAGDVRSGMIVRGEAGDLRCVSTSLVSAPSVVYNLSVAGDHTYFVGASPNCAAWVHNNCEKYKLYNETITDDFIRKMLELDETAAVGDAERSDVYTIFDQIEREYGEIDPSRWTFFTQKMSARAAAYQHQVTGAPIFQDPVTKLYDVVEYPLNGVRFDGKRGGVLVDAKGPGYANFICKKPGANFGQFYSWWKGADSLVAQAQRQVLAAEGTPIRWYVAEQEVVPLMQQLMNRAGVQIEVVFEAPVVP